MKEKIALVTGGSSGLGKKIAEELLKNGFLVYLVGRNEEKLKDTIQEFQQKYTSSVYYFCGDVSNEEFVKKIYLDLEKKNLTIDYLFNCAGVGRFGKVEENTLEKINVAFSGSLVGLILMSSYYVKQYKNKGGTIVNVMSSASLKGNKEESIYCAAKWGARGFTESLKTELKGSNIHVMSVYPGGMKTNFWSLECGANPEVEKFMDPEEVAEEIVQAVKSKKSLVVSELIIERK